MRRMLFVLSTAAMLTAHGAAQSAPSTEPISAEAKTLSEVANALGMLRGVQLRDVIATVEYYATGTQFAFGQAFRPGGPWPAFRITSYKASVAYDEPGMRVELERTNADGTTQGGGGLPLRSPQTQILVVSGRYAWNESEPGAGLAGTGIATPAAAAWDDRYLEFWMLPHAFVKAARMQSANTRVTSEAGATVVTTSVPDMPGVTMRAWLNEKNLIDRVESRLYDPVLGDTVVEVRYSGYKELGGEENPSDVLFPGRIVRTVGGHPVLDIIVSRGNTYNPYVIVPVPENIAKAAQQTAAERVEVQQVVSGVWHLTGGSHHSVAVEFKDHIAVIEGPQNEARAQAVIDAVKRTVPGKPIRYVINSHHHLDHSGGLRAFVAEGATVLTQAVNKPFYEKVWANPHTLSRDRLARGPRRPNIEGVADRRVLTDGTRVLQLHRLTGSNHADTMLVAYLPQEKILIEADVYTPAAAGALPGAVNPESVRLYETIEALKLDVETILPLHGRSASIAELRAAIGRNSTD